MTLYIEDSKFEIVLIVVENINFCMHDREAVDELR